VVGVVVVAAGVAATAAATPAATTTTPTTLASYTYNGDGLRTSKQTSTGTEQLGWDVSGSQPQLIVAGAMNFIYGPDGHAIEQIDGNGTAAYFLHDQLGSTRALLAQDGSVAATFSYDAFGRTTSATGTARTPLLYAGGINDTETGFYYLINRYYDPVTAQFLTVDPAYALTLSSYGYVNNDPLNSTDPSGEFLQILIPAAIGAAFGGVAGGLSYALQGGSSFRELGGAIAGGAIAGGCIGLSRWTQLAECGAATGIAGETTDELIRGKGFSAQRIAIAGALSGITGGLGNLIPKTILTHARDAVNPGIHIGINFFTSIGQTYLNSAVNNYVSGLRNSGGNRYSSAVC
jgi:RHS repeat-associated protein